MDKFKGDIVSQEVNFKIEEAKGDVDGVHVLGKVSGNFFVPEGVSRNKRYYSKSLWEKVVKDKDIRERLDQKRMFGTISHEQQIDDKAILDGKVSHIVTDLRLEESDGKTQGIGEALILNTPAGQILNTFLRAGSQLYVSSRAEGRYAGNHNGVPAVDEKSYKFQTFDFVIEPGFKEANPGLVENLQKIIDESGDQKLVEQLNLLVEVKKNDKDFNNDRTSNLSNGQEGEEPMDKELFEKVVNDNQKLKEDKSDLAKQVSSLQGTVDSQTSELTALKEELATTKGKLEKAEESAKLTDRYKSLGSPSEISEAFDEAEGVIKKYKELGTPEEIEEALDKSAEFITSTNEKLEELGSWDEIDEAIEKASGVINEYKPLGTPKEIQEVFTAVKDYAGVISEEKKAAKIKELAAELKVDESRVKMLWGKIEEDEIKEILGGQKEEDETRKKYERKENKDNEEIKEEKKSEGKFGKRASRLMEDFSV